MQKHCYFTSFCKSNIIQDNLMGGRGHRSGVECIPSISQALVDHHHLKEKVLFLKDALVLVHFLKKGALTCGINQLMYRFLPFTV